VLYLHGNDGNVSTSMDDIAPLRELQPQELRCDLDYIPYPLHVERRMGFLYEARIF
jgi:hypothetical protein